MSSTYATEAAFKTYIEYLALKRHFTLESFDYHKYNGKVNATFNKFQTRNDVFYFYKLSSISDKTNLILANILKNPNLWVRELLEESAQTVYLDWKKRIDALSYRFTSDLSLLKEDYQSNFVVSSGNHPHLINLFLQKKIMLETFTILVNVSNTKDYWKETITDKTIAPKTILLSSKYFPFLELDTKKYSQIVKNKFFS